MTEILAIDFGTSRTKVAYCDTRSGQPVLMLHNGLPFVPSLFYLPRGNEQVFWGQDAEESLEDDPAGVVDVLKRRLKEPLVRGNENAMGNKNSLKMIMNRSQIQEAKRLIKAWKSEHPG